MVSSGERAMARGATAKSLSSAARAAGTARNAVAPFMMLASPAKKAPAATKPAAVKTAPATKAALTKAAPATKAAPRPRPR